MAAPASRVISDGDARTRGCGDGTDMITLSRVSFDAMREGSKVRRQVWNILDHDGRVDMACGQPVSVSTSRMKKQIAQELYSGSKAKFQV